MKSPLAFKFYRPSDRPLVRFVPVGVRFIPGQYPEGVLGLVSTGQLPGTKVSAVGFEGRSMAVHFEEDGER